LANGKVFSGIGFGYPSIRSGEVVFNTGIVGYTESLTDPSYSGQILCLTYPLIGNYGVPDRNILDEFGLPKFFESDRIQCSGLIIHKLSDIASHWSCVKTLDEWLYQEKIPGIYDIDTRELTKIIRHDGVMMGIISSSKTDLEKLDVSKAFEKDRYDDKNFMQTVSSRNIRVYGNSYDKVIALIDTGTKFSIIRNLLKRGYKVVQLPWNASFDQVMSIKPKGVVISNGPGDPKMCQETIETAKQLIEKSIPTLGICLGNQILALSAGADTFKLKYGHRGQNKTCMNIENNQSYITSQNHGYGIDPKTLEMTGFETWFFNPDDQTIEGIIHKNKPALAVQFHPEASPGPYDCTFVFDKFTKIIDLNKR